MQLSSDHRRTQKTHIRQSASRLGGIHVLRWTPTSAWCGTGRRRCG